MHDKQKFPAARDGAAACKPRTPGPLARTATLLARLSSSRLNLCLGLASDCLVSAALVSTGIWYGQMHPALAVLTVLCGLLAFTFLEYAAHRWLFHGHTGPFEAGHTRHHLDPLGYDALPFFAPPLFMATLAGVFALAIPAGYALLLAGTIAAGYAAYGLSHVVIHLHRFKSPLMRRWVGFHNIHHYHPDTNYGVTTGLWDVILGTHYQRAPQPAVRRR